MLYCVRYKLVGLHVLFVVGRVWFVVRVLPIGCNAYMLVACLFVVCCRLLLVVVSWLRSFLVVVCGCV